MLGRPNGIYGIYLAAGQSSRMGCPKLELAFRGKTLGSHALDAACKSALDGVLVVTREQRLPSWLTSDFLDSPQAAKVRLVYCADAVRGQSRSLRCGIHAAARLEAEAAVVLLADQPLLRADAIDRLVDVYRSKRLAEKRPHYVAMCHDGIPKPPILFAAPLFPQLMELAGDEGARRLLRGYSPQHGIQLEEADRDLFTDVDVWEDYQELRSRG